MAGIKRKSVAIRSSEPKATSKKAKVEKATTNSTSKRQSKPVGKPKKAKEDSSDDFDESDTSEQENGFYGFSAAQDDEEEDVEDMDDADSSEAAAQQTASHNGKAHTRQAGNEGKDKERDSKFDASESKLAALNGSSFNPPCIHWLNKYSKHIAGSTHETKGSR